MPGSNSHKTLKSILINKGKEDLIRIVENSREEAQAYAFQLYCEGEFSFKGETNSLFAKIINAIKSILGISNTYGFSKPEGIFDALKSGELLDREEKTGSLDDSVTEQPSTLQSYC